MKKLFSQSSYYRWRFALILVLTAGLHGCAVFPALTQSLFMITPAQEVELGKQLKTELEKKDVVYVNDPVVDRYADQLGAKVVANAQPALVPVSFHVIKNAELNAFAIPGGDIFVHSGLIDAAEDEAELASVLAHELGHVIKRHSARQLSMATGTDYLVQLANQLLLGEDSGQAAQLLMSVAKQGLLFNYSRQDELEADAVAVNILDKAGYDPRAMESFFKKLIDKYGDQDPLIPFFATHPPTRERIDNVETMIKTLPPRDYQRPVTDLRTIQGRLESLGLK